jgi:hypothetical protein
VFRHAAWYVPGVVVRSRCAEWGALQGACVIFNGHNAQSPLVQGLRAIRLRGVNGTIRFRTGMLNMTPH